MESAANVWLGISLVDWIVILIYIITVTVIGVWSLVKVKDLSDYFMGGRRFGKIFMMFFAFGAGTSSEQAISVVAGTWRVGLAGIWWQFLWLWATPFYWLVAPIMRRMRALTTSDFFEARYHWSTSVLYSIFGMLMSITFIAGGLYGSGKMVDALTGGELESLGRRLNLTVPETTWNSEKWTLEPGVLFSAVSEPGLQDALNQGNLPPAMAELFDISRAPVLQNASVKTSGDDAWTIIDQDNGYRYPVSIKEETEEGQAVRYLVVRSSGWRRVFGYEYAILAMTVMFVLYGMAGGLGAAIITDFIQGVLTVTFSFLLLPFVFQAIGGFGMLHENSDIKTGMLELVASPDIAASLGKEPITIFYVFMLSVTALTGIVVQPHIMGVCGAGKTEFEGRFGFTFGNFLKRFCTVAWTFTGLACIVWYLGTSSPLKHAEHPLTAESGEAYAQLTPAEQAEQQAAFEELPAIAQRRIKRDRQTYEALTSRNDEAVYQDLEEAEKKPLDKIDRDFADALFGRAAFEILPTIGPGLIGLLMASLLAAVMSTSDAQMVVSSGLFTENIYRRFLVRDRTEKHYVWVGRFAGLVIVLMALVLQATFVDVIDALKQIINVPAAIGISLWIGIIWRGWTSAAVWVSAVVTALVWAHTRLFPGHYPEIMLNAQGKVAHAWQMLAFLSAGVLSGLLVSFVTPRVAKDKLDRFFNLLRTPVIAGEEVERPCTLPTEHGPQLAKLIDHPDIEIPRPTRADVLGFVGAWGLVGVIIWMTQYLAQTL